MAVTLHLAGNRTADALLERDPLALLLGMLLDQQVPMETAFAGPEKIASRMSVGDGVLDAASIADTDPEQFAALCATPPAVHRFPGSMAGRIQSLCRTIVDEYDGDASRIWTDGDPDGKQVLKRLKALPGYGDQKARIFLALLGKQIGVSPAGWREAAGAYGDDGARRSIADVVDDTTLLEVREFKKAAKAKAAQEKAAKAQGKS
ncbi:HhH-GPD-type base excision DNA repair protein [Rhodococcus sp. HNM0569]|uniref:HhH-GPD-type base excision DNA repair protein n=1 Tax=Rhodococcus sp. HNM0569 TaxID=2716340 RepID=UPI00146C22F1|nr:HhH-GPD-type base excision DNA repair protein [Rhodococcus sp. HNM0569]NLU83469.1 Fe-S cluster assembly protein HesB [Rhodococcus sp. HNM0569]